MSKSNILNVSKEDNDFPVHICFKKLGKCKFFNYDLAMHVGRRLFVDSVQLILDELIYIKSWRQIVRQYSRYNGRGKGYLTINALATFTTSSSRGRLHAVFSELCISCEEDEHYWRPNDSSSYFCLNGNEFSCIHSDLYSGNIMLAQQEGFGGYIPEKFKQNTSTIPWEELLRDLNK